MCVMISLIILWNTYIVSSAGSGVITTVDPVKLYQNITASFISIYDQPAGTNETKDGMYMHGLVFTIPNTKADEEYTIKIQVKDFGYNAISPGKSFSPNPTVWFIYFDSTPLSSSNYNTANYIGLNIYGEHTFDVVASEGSTSIYYYVPVNGKVVYDRPAVKANNLWSVKIAELSIEMINISYEKQVGGDELLEEEKKQTEVQKNIFQKISEFFSGFFDGIINAFMSLFVPDDDFFSDYFTRLNDFFTEKLGFLYVPIELLVKIINGISNASSAPPNINFPGVEWEGVYIIEPQIFSFSSLFEQFPGLQDAIYLGTDIIMIGALFLLFQNKLKEVLTK